MAKKTEKFSEVVAEVLRLATAIRDYWAVELPRVHPDYPLVRPDDLEETPPPEEKQLRDYLKKKPAEVVYRIALLARLWRAGFRLDNLAEAYEEVKAECGSPREAIELLLGTGSLADYLEEGIATLQRVHLDLDEFPRSPVAQGS